MVGVDQSPIGRTPRSNPATYTGVFDHIRKLFAATTEAKVRGYQPGRFSFNVKGGRCEACAGDGTLKIEMNFLPDIYVPCEVCKGARYNRETLDVHYKGKTIADVLNTPIEEAEEFFRPIGAIHRHLKTLVDVGLGYVRLGQPAPTLSGGEAQRVKLGGELQKRSTGRTVYILDEPTTGLHFADVEKLLGVINGLVNKGNTVIVIEHNLDVIKSADYIIDMGPEGGAGGGRVVATGTPEQVAADPDSFTGQFLAPILAGRGHVPGMELPTAVSTAAARKSLVRKTSRGGAGKAAGNGKSANGAAAGGTADRNGTADQNGAADGKGTAGRNGAATSGGPGRRAAGEAAARNGAAAADTTAGEKPKSRRRKADEAPAALPMVVNGSPQVDDEQARAAARKTMAAARRRAAKLR
jgi:excinuclease ABC subunit A